MGTPKGQSKHMLGINPALHPLTSQWIKANKQYWQRATRDMIEAALRSGELPMILPGRQPRKPRKPREESPVVAAIVTESTQLAAAPDIPAPVPAELEDPFPGSLPVSTTGLVAPSPDNAAVTPADVQPQASPAPEPVPAPPVERAPDPVAGSAEAEDAAKRASYRAKALQALNQNSF